MALITDYTTLTTAIADYLARNDLTTFVPNFLQNCQNKLYRTMRIRAMETALAGTMASGVLALPADYLELKQAYIDTNPPVPLERTTRELIYSKYRAGNLSGRPRSIARDIDSFIFGPAPDSDYDVAGTYYKLLPILSGDNTTNWFTDNASELLLYGSLLEAQPFLMNDKRIGVWQNFFNDSMASIDLSEQMENHSGSTLAARAC
jgi:hypothetical protein